MEFNYLSKYNNSWALVIGINKYQYVNPLEYARNDAEAIVEILITKFGFPKENVISLFDQDATKKAILSNYMSFSQSNIKENDRILVFFAGHGHTLLGNRNNIGYLIPVDGTLDDISTFIRWDELTRNTDLIKAKHIFFIMDACFSGLAITRSLPPGSTRYLKNMLERYSRQVLTAGKADEVVADSGGPIPEHSIFTGHLINGLEGEAASSDGIITANRLMAYVTDKVSRDQYSNQSPHYGYFDGDGDFIFNVPMSSSLKEADKFSEDKLIEIPIISDRNIDNDENKLLEDVKLYLSDESTRIKLDTIITQEIRRYLSLSSKEYFPIDSGGSPITNNDVRNRLEEYERISQGLQKIVVTVAYWGYPTHNHLLRKIITRLADHIEVESGTGVWLKMRWYPISILIYVATIAAIENERYDTIASILTTEIVSEESSDNNSAIEATVKAMLELDRSKVFQAVHEENPNYYAPRSEYMFKVVQPILDDILFLGKSYEYLFDKAEVFIALIFADLTKNSWGPPGRFAWKYRRGYSTNPFAEIVKEADLKKDEWAPLKAGLFSGSYENFKKVANNYEELLKRLDWY
ncbi:caspase family protein [Anaerosinus gibii]|uniref:Caspase family protein n=1 Tax=Selenobaculum gibii TaxID=3054208 RepID=A0A9Y2AHP2_9FIRM|nr:caspase family protein [Selenobaculum gbiensis]WIW70274.1 caspase family protein [Selenobaculum gbiensis]